jgi:hypothetical protein
MNNNIIIGIDLAKNVFQLHRGRCCTEGELAGTRPTRDGSLTG